MLLRTSGALPNFQTCLIWRAAGPHQALTMGEGIDRWKRSFEMYWERELGFKPARGARSPG
jgi:hypothetical protein